MARISHEQRRERNYPYKFAGNGLEFGVQEFEIGGSTGDPNYDEMIVPLYKFDGWDEASLSVDVTVEESTLERLFGDVERWEMALEHYDRNLEEDEYPAKISIIVECKQTQDRYEVEVENPVSAGSHEATIEFDRDEIRGPVTLKPSLVRTEDSDDGLPYAPNRGMKMATGTEWTVVADLLDEDGNGFPTAFRDFSEDGRPPEGLIHDLHSASKNPKVLVNELNEPIVDVLTTNGNAGFRPYMREVVAGEIASMTWIQLVVHTASTIADEGEPEFAWQEGVVEEISEYIFDEDLEYEQAVERLGEQVDDPSNLPGFIRDLNRAVQLYDEIGQPENLNRFIEKEAP